jgi:P-type Ca2+ transporter type 2C
LLILVANAVVSIWQDSNADNALEALKNMQALKCKVLRNSYWTIADSKDLVPGDVVEVVIGDRIPADVRVAKLISISLQVDQAPLTGETVSV